MESFLNGLQTLNRMVSDSISLTIVTLPNDMMVQDISESGSTETSPLDYSGNREVFDDGNERLNDLLPLALTAPRYRFRRNRNVPFPIRYTRRPRFRSVQSSLVNSGNIADMLADHFGVKHNKVLRYGIS